MRADPWHCLTHVNSATVSRHNSIVDVIADYVRRAGGQVWVEPRHDPDAEDRSDRRRPDLFVVLGPAAFYVDAAVVHPTSTSYLRAAAQRRLGAARIAEQRKERRHSATSAAGGATFVPFVLETYGGFGEQARAFIRLLADYAAPTGAASTAPRSSPVCALGSNRDWPPATYALPI